MKNNKSLSPISSLALRIPLIILLVLILAVGSATSYCMFSLYRTLMETNENRILREGELIWISIKNIMLEGQAPIGASLMQSMARSDSLNSIKLYRTDGTIAFSNDDTIQNVNKTLDEERFEPSGVPVQFEKNNEPGFNKAVNKVIDVYMVVIHGGNESLVLYKPLINQPRCSQCHGVDHTVRGIIRVSNPLESTTFLLNNLVIKIAVIYSAVLMLLTVLIMIYLKKRVFSPLTLLGQGIDRAGAGDFSGIIRIRAKHEIGLLAEKANAMMQGLKNRIVDPITADNKSITGHEGKERTSVPPEKCNLTLIISEIKDFISYSEYTEPNIVFDTLSALINIQSAAAQEYGGVVQSASGCILTVIFEGNDMTIRGVKAAEKIRADLTNYIKDRQYLFTVGIGISAGEVIRSMSTGFSAIIGETVQLCEKLCAVAGKNTIILSEDIYRSLEGLVVVSEHDPIKVRGREDGVKIYSLRKTV